MSVFRPFHALMPRPEDAARVSAPPYDVVNTVEAKAMAEGNELSFLRVSRPEIELETGINLYSDRVYAKAHENFRRLINSAPLTEDPEENLYIYSLSMNGRTQTGIAGTASAAEYDAGLIRKHEKTRRDKEDDRARHVMELRSQTGPVFLTYRDNAKINAAVSEITARPPLFVFTAPDGVEHKLWKAGAESRTLSRLFASEVQRFYIADGHHRAASAARAAAKCRTANPAHTGCEEYNFFLAVAFPKSQLAILPYNRAVKDLNKLSPAEFLKKVTEKFHLEKTSSPVPPESGAFCILLENSWYLARPAFDLSGLDLIQRLDVSILQDNLLSPLLGINDPRTDPRIDFIGGIRGTGELEKRICEGSAAVCFSMYPVTLDQLMDIADADKIMPPKSTWFEPKLRDGLLCHNF